MRNKDTILLEDAYNSIHNKPTEAMTENEEITKLPKEKVLAKIEQVIQALNQNVDINSINTVTKMTNDLVRGGGKEYALVLWSEIKKQLDMDKFKNVLNMTVKGDYDTAAKDEFLNKSLPALKKILNPSSPEKIDSILPLSIVDKGEDWKRFIAQTKQDQADSIRDL
jgi:hypothetical protein